MHSTSNRFARYSTHSLLVVLLTASVVFVGCSKSNQVASAAPQAMEVNVLVVAPESIALTQELPGRVSALRMAEVRARISGILQKRLFTEGSDVKEGQVLFEIDPAPYQAVLDSAKAALARAEASLVAGELQADRYKGLVETNAISKQTYDDAEATRLSRRADVLAARAAVRSAEINLEYTQVVSPITGRIGRAAVTEGAYVQQSSATLLATVQQLDPLYVDLSQPAEEVLRLKQALASGRLQRSSEGGAKLTLRLSNGQDYGQPGSLQFSDVSVNTGTGTVTLRGLVPNPNLDLLPGMFVRARIDEGRNPSAMLLSQSLVRRNAKGQGTVLIAGADGKVELRIVETGETLGNRWLITSGLRTGDLVILDNLQKIRPGMTVKPVKPAAASTQVTPAR